MQKYGGLCDKRAYLAVLGSLMQNPSLANSIERPLTKQDFDTEQFYVILFVAVFNLYNQGIEKIDEFTIDSFLSNYPKQYKIFQDNEGLKWVSDAIQMAQMENYDYFYHRVKKFSLLRYYESKGLDTTCILDLNKVDTAEEQRRFNEITEQEIIEQIESTFVIEPKENYCCSQLTQSIQAGFGIDEMVEEYLKTPDYGFSMVSKAANTLCRGLRRGKLYFRCAPTSVGKTRMFLMDACNFAVPYTYDLEKKEFVYTGHDTPTLFYGTEMSLCEWQSILTSCVSGVDERHIILGQYEEGEYERVIQANKYIKDAPLFLVYCDDFTVSEIENTVKKFVIQKNIDIFIFDYIQATPRLMNEINIKASVKNQEYQALLQFASRLKALAEHLDIAIFTGTQLRSDTKDLLVKDESAMQGSKAMGQKCDIGCNIYKLSKSEKAKVAKITANMLGCPEINRLVWFWKIRQGSMASIIVACHCDLSNMRLQDIFVMDYDFNLINLDFTKIEEVKKVINEQSRNIRVDADIEDDDTEDDEEDDNEIKETDVKPTKIVF